jgi:hypothetical protein
LLEVAVETGFHSLVELIAKHETHQSSKDAALALAVSTRRLDLVELLVADGADIQSVPLVDVLLTWEPKIIRFFLDHGADAVGGRPFAEHSAPRSEPHFGYMSSTSERIRNSQHSYRSKLIVLCAISAAREV